MTIKKILFVTKMWGINFNQMGKKGSVTKLRKV